MKTCLIDNIVQEKLVQHIENYTLLSSAGASSLPVGLLIGQCSNNDDDKLLVIDCLPSQDGDRGSGISLFDISEECIANHATQITQLLAGGLDVIGLYVIAKSTADIRKCTQGVCAAWLHSMVKKMKKEKYSHGVGISQAVLYIYDMQSGKFSGRVLDVCDARSEAKPLDVKVQAVRHTFHSISTMFTLSCARAVGERESRRNVGKQVLSLCLQHCAKLDNAHYTFNKQWKNKDCQLLDINSHIDELTLPAKSTKDKKGRVKKVELSGQEFTVDIFMPYEDCSEVESSSPITCGGKAVIDGCLQVVAYVHNKARISDTINAVCTDIRRSITARCSILSEDESLYEHETAPNTRYEFPLRSFIKLPSTATAGLANIYSYYDYYEMNANESCEEILSAISELVADKLSVDDFVKSAELLAVGSDHGSEYASSEHGSDDEHIKVISAHGERLAVKHSLVYVVVGALGVLSALVLAYIYKE